MKKAFFLGITALLVAGCSSMNEVPEFDNYAQPDWYQECAQSGMKGFFWNKEEYVYACGAGDSIHAQAAEEQMYAIAMNNFAKRINGSVTSETLIDINDTKKTTRSTIVHRVSDTAIREHVKTQRGHFTMKGRHYTFVRLEMPKSTFDRLIAEAQDR